MFQCFFGMLEALGDDLRTREMPQNRANNGLQNPPGGGIARQKKLQNHALVRTEYDDPIVVYYLSRLHRRLWLGSVVEDWSLVFSSLFIRAISEIRGPLSCLLLEDSP